MIITINNIMLGIFSVACFVHRGLEMSSAVLYSDKGSAGSWKGTEAGFVFSDSRQATS